MGLQPEVLSSDEVTNPLGKGEVSEIPPSLSKLLDGAPCTVAAEVVAAPMHEVATDRTMATDSAQTGLGGKKAVVETSAVMADKAISAVAAQGGESSPAAEADSRPGDPKSQNLTAKNNQTGPKLRRRQKSKIRI